MSKKNILLLGLGRQGKAALYDLVNHSDATHITVVDNRADLEAYLARYPSGRVTGRKIDAADEAVLSALMKTADVVVEALPASYALKTARTAAKLGVNLVNSMYCISPQESDAEKVQIQKEIMRGIDREAKAKKVTILPEFGLDPGIDLVLGAQALSELDEVYEFFSYGAGFPTLEAATNPLKYKFSWSVIGVMRAYLRPAKIISKGQIVEIEANEIFAKENIHSLELKEIGVPLECYPNGNSLYYAELFGLRNSIQEMGRYACRLPGHCAFWEVIAKCGFLDEPPIKVGKTPISPVQFTASLLGGQSQFRYADSEQDVTLIRVDVRGKREGKRRRIIYQLIDRRDLKTGFTSMQRTVGFTMSLGAQLIMENRLKKTGLLSPIDVPYDLLVRGLEKHGMKITRHELPWGSESP
jgi:saccharopine dehydrogenase-like NADP-dependent oxidoreductase